MSDQSFEEQNQTALQIAEAVAPGWGHRRDFVETVSAPVRSRRCSRALRPERDAVRDRIEEGFAPFAVDDGGYELPGRAVCAVGELTR